MFHRVQNTPLQFTDTLTNEKKINLTRKKTQNLTRKIFCAIFRKTDQKTAGVFSLKGIQDISNLLHS